jgi:hypothetical protein
LPSFPGASTISSSSRFVVEGVFWGVWCCPFFQDGWPEAVRLCLWVLYFLGRFTNPSAKPPFLEDQIISLSPAALLRPVRLGRPYQEHKVPAGIARKVIEAPKPTTPPPHDKVEKGGELYNICVD